MSTIAIVVGADQTEDFDLTYGLLRRLRFAEVSLAVAHVIEPVHPAALAISQDAAYALAQDLERILEASEKHADSVLRHAAETASADGLQVTLQVLKGHRVDELLKYCESMDADLVAVGSESKGPIASVLFGSVSRALAQHAKRSLLVAKPGRPNGALHAVVATDHSPYMERCLDELLRLHPTGISRLDIITAFRAEDYLQMHSLGEMPVMGIDVLDRIERDLHEANDRVKHKLRPLAPTIHSEVVRDGAIHAIATHMKESGADLLILGAQGHSAIERLLLGSVSHHMIAVEPFPVLLLRPKGAA
jgi:nucleotide-binding universal stress UspA family protein